MGTYSEAQAAALLRQVADATAFLHSQGLCHGDIKPENLLLAEVDDGEGVHKPEPLIKLVDFGFSCERCAARARP